MVLKCLSSVGVHSDTVRLTCPLLPLPPPMAVTTLLASVTLWEKEKV